MNMLPRITILGLSAFLFSCSDTSEDSSQSKSVAAAPGEAIYTKNCKVCHAQGINGAPILGNQKMWSNRITKGEAILIQHAINGFGLMPPKGGQTQLSDDEVAKVVKYMLSQL